MTAAMQDTMKRFAKGSMTVLLQSLPAARIGDPSAHGGAIGLGFSTVINGG